LNKVTKYCLILLFFYTQLNLSSCGNIILGSKKTTLEQAEKVRAKEKKQKGKIAKKEKKKAEKEFWRMQSKTARKRVKRTLKQRRKEARKN
jgi:hypothetical protein